MIRIKKRLEFLYLVSFEREKSNEKSEALLCAELISLQASLLSTAFIRFC